MTTKADFNAEEWSTVVEAPVYAAMRVITADRGGTLRESLAMGHVYQEARGHHGESELLDELVNRARGREQDRPTFAYFQMQLENIFPSLRNDREFTRLVIDTLKIERAAYRELSSYCAACGWPAWT